VGRAPFVGNGTHTPTEEAPKAPRSRIAVWGLEHGYSNFKRLGPTETARPHFLCCQALFTAHYKRAVMAELGYE
jgi:hypothetical protein